MVEPKGARYAEILVGHEEGFCFSHAITFSFFVVYPFLLR